MIENVSPCGAINDAKRPIGMSTGPAVIVAASPRAFIWTGPPGLRSVRTCCPWESSRARRVERVVVRCRASRRKRSVATALPRRMRGQGAGMCSNGGAARARLTDPQDGRVERARTATLALRIESSGRAAARDHPRHILDGELQVPWPGEYPTAGTRCSDCMGSRERVAGAGFGAETSRFLSLYPDSYPELEENQVSAPVKPGHRHGTARCGGQCAGGLSSRIRRPAPHDEGRWDRRTTNGNEAKRCA